jgi:hypothetical protein
VTYPKPPLEFSVQAVACRALGSKFARDYYGRNKELKKVIKLLRTSGNKNNKIIKLSKRPFFLLVLNLPYYYIIDIGFSIFV